MTRGKIAIAVAAGLVLALMPVSSLLAADTPEQQRAQARKEVPATVAAFKKADPGIDKFFAQSAGYVVFPKIGKVGFVVGGGHGIGEVFEGGKSIGTATTSFGTVGLQAGIQEFSEIIFFQNAATLDRLKVQVHAGGHGRQEVAVRRREPADFPDCGPVSVEKRRREGYVRGVSSQQGKL